MIVLLVIIPIPTLFNIVDVSALCVIIVTVVVFLYYMIQNIFVDIGWCVFLLYSAIFAFTVLCIVNADNAVHLFKSHSYLIYFKKTYHIYEKCM